MFKLSLLFPLVLSFFLIACNEKDITNYPKPTDTYVKMDMEDGDKSSQRKKYIDLVHGGDAIDWRSIEAQNAKDLLAYKEEMRRMNTDRSEEEWVANGYVKGKWIERGSSNQAGNITTTAYDADNDIIYCIGGGGPIFKGNRYGIPWELVNDDLRFSSNMLEVLTLDNGLKRLIAAINSVPHYSDDEGATWNKSAGVSATGGATIYDQEMTSNQDIFFLHKYDHWSDLYLYKSVNFGESYVQITKFNTSDVKNLSLAKAVDSDDIFIIEQLDADKSKLYKFNINTDKLDIVNAEMPVGFGENGRANLIVRNQDSLKLHIYDNDRNFRVSLDSGITWETISILETTPWSVGVFMARSNPNQLIYGEVNSYRSQAGGEYWLKISDWWEYYDNVEFKLHADIMCIDEYYTSGGESFILIGNHGGTSITEDYGKTNTNIGMLGLNVGQFYDVASYPPNPIRMFGGTQDQGLQKGKMRNEDPDNFIQMISGDYGHIKFTGENRDHMWVVYPGGWISYYKDPLVQDGPDLGYTIDSKNETVWISPIIPSENPENDVVYAAGGSIDTGSVGSHILKLTATNNEIIAEELPFDFSVSDGQIASMAISPFNKDMWFVATTSGYIYRSLDRGITFELIRRSISGAHYLYGSCILPSKVDSSVIYISGNGYGTIKPVYRSTDGGATFGTMHKGLPETTVFKLAANEDESLIFAATEAGPYVWVADQEEWFSLVGDKTPNQTYWSVEFVEEFNLARFSTYGRGIWDFQVVSQDPTSTEEVANVETIDIYPNPNSGVFNVNYLTSTPQNIQIINNQGQQIKAIINNETGTDELHINLDQSPDGIYYLRALIDNKYVTKQFIKSSN